MPATDQSKKDINREITNIMDEATQHEDEERQRCNAGLHPIPIGRLPRPTVSRWFRHWAIHRDWGNVWSD